VAALPPEPPDEQPPPPPPAVDAEGGECPRCGTPYGPLQEYCLECGLRLPVARGLIPVLATAWRRRLPWYPGDWIWPVLLALVIAALAAAIAILANRDEGSPGRTQAATNVTVPVGTGTGPAPTEPTGTSPVPTTPGTTETTPTEPEPPPPPPPTSGTLTEWPVGQNGWTIVLASLPQNAGRAIAVRDARKAIAAGLTDVGVLNSSEYSSLHAGYFVVFSGIFDSNQEAKDALDTAKSSYPQAYVRQIVQ
jgi:hypothetical protein